MRRLFWLLLLILVLVCTARITGGYFLGNFVTGILEKGTGAQVQITDPRIEFFPPGATASGFSIRSAGEEGNSTAEYVTVDVDFPALLKRQVIMSNFRIEGAKIDSRNEQSGFIKLIQAITRKPKDPQGSDQQQIGEQSLDPELALEQERPKKKNKWKTWVKDITVIASDEPDSLILNFTKFRVVSNNAVYSMSEADEPKTFNAKFFGTTTRLKHTNGTELHASDVNFKGLMGKGIIEFQDSSFSYQDRNHIAFEGDMVVGKEGYYQIEYQSRFSNDYIKSIKLGGSTPIPFLKTDLKMKGTLTNSLISPDLAGEFEAEILDNVPAISLEQCSPKNLKGEFLLKDKSFRMFQLNSHDFLTFGEFDLELNGPKPVSFRGSIEFDSENEFYRGCLDQIYLLSASLNDLSESRQKIKNLDFDYSGVLEGPVLKGKIESELETMASNSNASLDVDMEWERENLKISYSEAERIEGASRDLSQSISSIERGGVLNAELEINLLNRQFNLKKFQSDNYPGKRLLGRLSPFMTEDTASTLGKVLGSRSLISANLKESLNSNWTSVFDLGGQIVISNLIDDGSRENSVECDLKSSNEGVELNNCILALEGGRVTLSGLLKSGGGGDLSLWADKFDLDSFYSDLPFKPVVGGEFLLSFDDAKNISFQGAGDSSLLSRKNSYRVVDSGFKVKGDSKKIELQLLGGKGIKEGSATIPLGTSSQLASVQLELANFSLGQSPEAARENFLNGRLDYSGSLSDALAGTGNLKISKINMGGKSVEGIAYPLELELKEGGVEFDRIRFISGGADLLIDGRLNKASGWNLSLNGSLSLDQLNWVQSNLEQLSGAMDMDLRITGKAAQPELYGSADLVKGLVSFAIGRSIVGANEIQGRLNFKGKDLSIADLSARVGRGNIKGAGEWKNFLSPDQRNLDLGLTLKDIELSPSQELSLNFGGKLFLVKTEDSSLALKGDIELDKAYYENSVDLFRMLASARDSIIGGEIQSGGSSGGAGIEYDLSLSGDNSILVETNIAKLEMTPELKILGSDAGPTLEGKIVLEQGTFGLQPEQFQLVSGELSFSSDADPNNPELNIVGETGVNVTTGEVVPLRINIAGTVTSPDVTFFSDSGLSDEELVALLGFKGNSLTLAEESEKELSIVEIINPTSDISLAERLTGLTGFSRLGIDSTFSDTTGELVPLVTAERKFSDLSSLHLESELRGEFNSAIFADYPLSDSVDVLAGWRSKAVTDDVDDSSGTFGVDFIYERELPSFSLFSNGFKEKSRELGEQSD